MSRANLDHFARALPRLEAQETLVRYHAAVLASGNVKKESARAAIRNLERQARGGSQAHAYRPSSREERHSIFASLGVVDGR